MWKIMDQKKEKNRNMEQAREEGGVEGKEVWKETEVVCVWTV
jgi:hypothetical protein